MAVAAANQIDVDVARAAVCERLEEFFDERERKIFVNEQHLAIDRHLENEIWPSRSTVTATDVSFVVRVTLAWRVMRPPAVRRENDRSPLECQRKRAGNSRARSSRRCRGSGILGRRDLRRSASTDAPSGRR